MKQFILTGFMLLYSLYSFPQAGNFAFKVGDTLPGSFWSGSRQFLERGHLVSKNLEAFRGKPLVLDFWATWCAPCLAGMFHQHELLKKSGNGFNLIRVTKENDAVVSRFFKTGKNPLGAEFSSVIGDLDLNGRFLHNGIPHLVWIDGDGVFLGASGGDFFIEENITALLAGRFLPPLSTYVFPNTGLYLNKNPKGMVAFNVLSRGAVSGLSGTQVRSFEGNTGKVIFNSSLRWIYNVLARKQFDWFTAQRIFLDFHDQAAFNNYGKDPANLFNVDFWLPSAKLRELPGLMMEFMNTSSGYCARPGIRFTRCYVMRFQPSKVDVPLSTKGGAVVNDGFQAGGRFINQPVKNLVLKIMDLPWVKLPVVDETGFSSNIDMELSVAGNLKALNEQMGRYGIRISEEGRELKMLVITKDK